MCGLLRWYLAGPLSRCRVSPKVCLALCIRFSPPLRQDFAVSVPIMWGVWKQRKASSEDIKKDLLRSRERGALAAWDNLEALLSRERHQSLQSQISEIQAALRKQQHPFRDHELVNVFLEQFSGRNWMKWARFRFLVLVGPSVQGKTSKAMSLYPDQTLKVCCGTCPDGILPSIASFDWLKHKAIVFDEARPDQVLRNREVFQANQYAQTLGQSACNAFSYQVYLYHRALILCANSWDLSADSITSSDREWLEANQILVKLPEGQRWYLQSN